MPYRRAEEMLTGGGEPGDVEVIFAEKQETDESDELKRVEVSIRVVETSAQCAMWVRLPREGVGEEEASRRLGAVGSHLLTEHSTSISRLQLDDEARILEVTTKPGSGLGKDNLIRMVKELDDQQPIAQESTSREDEIAKARALAIQACDQAAQPAVA